MKMQEICSIYNNACNNRGTAFVGINKLTMTLTTTEALTQEAQRDIKARYNSSKQPGIPL
jgi:hypothetical protein